VWIKHAFFHIETLSHYIPAARPGRIWWSGVALMAIGLLLQACEASPSTTPVAQIGQLSVAATIYPMQFLVERIGGERVAVQNLVPTGVESHDWEPSPRDLRGVYDADVFVHSGTGFEGWVDRLLRDLDPDQPRVISTAPGMMEDDPHLWLDPTRYALHAERVRDGLVQADPVGASIYDANLSTLQDELSALEAEMELGLAVCDRNTVVVSHAAYGHLTRRFGLNQIAIAGVSPEVEPSTARVRAVIEQALNVGATHVLYEPLVTPRIAQTIAAEAELALLPLDPVERLTEEQASANVDYFSVMRDNLVTLRTALGCQ
jgi:zinc transport system substrate-binding protein